MIIGIERLVQQHVWNSLRNGGDQRAWDGSVVTAQ